MRFVDKKYFLGLVLTLLCCSLFAQSNKGEASVAVKYEVSFSNAAHHEIDVKLQILSVQSYTVTLRMSHLVTGKYVFRDFSSNVYNIAAYDVQTNNKIEMIRLDKDVYRILNNSKPFYVTYSVYGNALDGLSLGVDKTHANINLASVLYFPQEYLNQKAEIEFKPLPDWAWEASSQLQKKSRYTFFANRLEDMIASMVELSHSESVSWPIKNSLENTQSVAIVMHGRVEGETLKEYYLQWVKRLISEERNVFGEYPEFDFGVYTFVQDIHPENKRTSNTFRNSSFLTTADEKLDSCSMFNMLDLAAHQFFKSWNGTRLKPKSLASIEVGRATTSEDLWLTEGFTHYYANLTQKRIGAIAFEEYIQRLSNSIYKVLSTPGARMYSPAEMSSLEVFYGDDKEFKNSNKGNIYVPPTDYGTAVALLLDLQLRTKFNLSLDGYMQLLWNSFGKPEKHIDANMMKRILQTYTKNARFADDFFSQIVYGIPKKEYFDVLEKVGLKLVLAQPNRAWWGNVELEFKPNQNPKITKNIYFGEPLYKTDIDIGDTIVSISDIDIKDPVVYSRLFDGNKPHETVPVTYLHRGELKTTNVTLEENPNLRISTFEEQGLDMDENQKLFRHNWLNTKHH